jgi:hypothetical protein
MAILVFKSVPLRKVSIMCGMSASAMRGKKAKARERDRKPVKGKPVKGKPRKARARGTITLT